MVGCLSNGGIVNQGAWFATSGAPRVGSSEETNVLSYAQQALGHFVDREELALGYAIIGAAVQRTSDRIASEQCAALFLAPDHNEPENRRALSSRLDGAMNQGLIRPIVSGPGAAVPANVPAFTTDTLGLIYVVIPSVFFSGVGPNTQPIGQTAEFAGMSATQFQEAVIIHEFLHHMGIAGPDNAGQSYALPNGRVVAGSRGISEAVRDACFR